MIKRFIAQYKVMTLYPAVTLYQTAIDKIVFTFYLIKQNLFILKNC